MSSAELKANRPLSPHLSIYRFYLTMLVSGMQRITGLGVYVGTVFVAWWLLAAATSATAFNFINGLIGSWIGLVLLFFFSFALVFHTVGGLRYLVMDIGRGFDEAARNGMALASIVVSVVLTVVLWAVALAI